jgi:PAS domain S-box-containing protein
VIGRLARVPLSLQSDPMTAVKETKAPSNKSEPVSQARSSTTPARVLVVDDDEKNLLAIENVLNDVAEVVVARSGEDALRHLLHGEFAVILLDVYMPGMDGYETAGMIRSREQTKRIPIVFLSAVNKEIEHLIRGYAMGAVDYVFKPVEPVVLRSKVAVFVDLFLMRREIQIKAEQEQAFLDEALAANTERLRVERELRLLEQRQSAIIESLPIILYLEATNVVPRRSNFVSGDLMAMIGFTAEEIARCPTLWHDRLHPEDRDRAEAAHVARGAGGSLAMEYRWQRADGRYVHILDQAFPLPETEGQPFAYAGTLLDMTERKDLETQLLHVRKMDAIGKLTGGIAHDFNNLLAAVIGGLGMIERRVKLDDEQRKLLSMTQHAAGKGTELVARLLAFARKQKLDPAPIDVPALAEAVNNLLSHTLGGLVELAWDIASDIGQPYADEAQLELALMNLAINARDAMPEGGTICVCAHNAEIDAASDRTLALGSYVVLTVSDTGQGIPRDLLERVLEPFFTTKDVGKGTGLGLSMVYGFVSQSGGAMRINSVENEGTSVELWLPCARTTAGAPVSVAEAAVVEVGRSLNLLLVDDHDAVRVMTAALLKDFGHIAHAAVDGNSVLERLRENPEIIDLLITDYAMPHLSGSEVIRRARLIRPGLPAIIITGYAENSTADLLSEGVIVLSKPFMPAELSDAIARAMASPNAPPLPD